MPTYAIVKTGGKQYRVETGQKLLVEKLGVDEGATVTLEPLLYRSDDEVITDGNRLGEVSVTAKVLAHERGPKLRVFKFKPKRGYRRLNGHRQPLTRIEIATVALGAKRRTRAKAASDAETDAAVTPKPKTGAAAGAARTRRSPAAPKKPASGGTTGAKPSAPSDEGGSDGA
jgi:large subunit ribosomal protein L21